MTLEGSGDASQFGGDAVLVVRDGVVEVEAGGDDEMDGIGDVGFWVGIVVGCGTEVDPLLDLEEDDDTEDARDDEAEDDDDDDDDEAEGDDDGGADDEKDEDELTLSVIFGGILSSKVNGNCASMELTEELITGSFQ
jgi:hypothetical protein